MKPAFRRPVSSWACEAPWRPQTCHVHSQLLRAKRHFSPCNSAWCRILRGCDRALFSFAGLVVGLLKDGFAFYGVLLAGLFRIDMSLLFALFFRKVLLLVLLFLMIFRTGILILWIAWSLIGWWKGLGSASRCLFIFLFLLCLFYYQLLIMASLTWKCNFFISQVEARIFFHCLN